MELPTYTSIWRIEKRLYKLYDFRLPMPLPVGQIAVFTAVTVPYIVLLTLFGLPFNHNLFWLYVLPPGLLTWLATRPVLESKRLPELLISQVRYLGEPSTWCRMAPSAEKDQVVVFGRVWRRVSAAEQEQVAGEQPARALPVAVPVTRPALAQATAADPVLARRARSRGRLVRTRQVPEGQGPGPERAGFPQPERVRETGAAQEGRWPHAPGYGYGRVAPGPARAAGPDRPAAPPAMPAASAGPAAPDRAVAPDRTVAPDTAMGPDVSAGPDRIAGPSATPAGADRNARPGWTAQGMPPVGAGWARDAIADPGLAGSPSTGRHAAPPRPPAPAQADGTARAPWDRPGTESGTGADAGTGWPMVGYGPAVAIPPGVQGGDSGPGQQDRRGADTALGTGWPADFGVAASQPPAGTASPTASPSVPDSSAAQSAVPPAVASPGSAPEGAGPAFQETGPALEGTGPAFQESGFAPGEAERGLEEAGPGLQESGFAPQETEPAANDAGPGFQETRFAPQETGRVLEEAGPAFQGPGFVRETEPAANEVGPVFQESGFAPHEADPALEEARPALPVTGSMSQQTEPALEELPAPGPFAPDTAGHGAEGRDAAGQRATAPGTAVPDEPVAPPPAPQSIAPPPAPQPSSAQPQSAQPPTVQQQAVQQQAAQQPAAPPPTAPSPTAPPVRRPAPVTIVPAQRATAGASQAPPAQPRQAPAVERALSGPGERPAGWRSHVTVVPGGRGPGRPDHVKEARARAVLPLDRPRLVVVLGCTVGAGQTVVTLMLADLLAGLRGEPVAALDLNPGPASLTELARVPAITVSALLADRAPGAHAAHRGAAPGHRGQPARGARNRGRLDVICQDMAPDGSVALPNLQHDRLVGVLASRYPLTLADPGAPAVAKLLAEAGQLVLVAPASPDAAQAVSMTCEWLGGHGHAALAQRSIAVLNGVSQRSVRHAEQAELVLRGRCRAIVRVPWDDHLAEPEAERGIRDSLDDADGPQRLARLRPAVLQAYTALAGVLVSSLTDDPVRRRAAR